MDSSSQKYCRMFSAIFAAMVALTIMVATVSANAQTYSPLYLLPGSPGGANPIGLIAQGRDGNMYAVTSTGGTDYGTVFRFTPAGSVAVINQIGYFPWGGLTLGTDGNLYGQDGDGGVVGNCGLAASGQVYKMTPAGVMTVLHNFTGGTDGCNPQAAPIEGSNGIFYGSTPNENNGTIYSVTSGGTFTTLHTFTGTDGQGVYAPLLQGSDGDFYGATVYGGSNGDGVIYKMTPAGAVTVLHNFTGAPDGASPYYGSDAGQATETSMASRTGGHFLRNRFQNDSERCLNRAPYFRRRTLRRIEPQFPVDDSERRQTLRRDQCGRDQLAEEPSTASLQVEPTRFFTTLIMTVRQATTHRPR